MDELENKLGAILGNPEMMEKIAAFAQTLGPRETAGCDENPQNAPPVPEFDPSMLQKLSGIAGQTGIDHALLHHDHVPVFILQGGENAYVIGGRPFAGDVFIVDVVTLVVMGVGPVGGDGAAADIQVAQYKVLHTLGTEDVGQIPSGIVGETVANGQHLQSVGGRSRCAGHTGDRRQDQS